MKRKRKAKSEDRMHGNGVEGRVHLSGKSPNCGK